jgi:hypothetical protein
VHRAAAAAADNDTRISTLPPSPSRALLACIHTYRTSHTHRIIALLRSLATALHCTSPHTLSCLSTSYSDTIGRISDATHAIAIASVRFEAAFICIIAFV